MDEGIAHTVEDMDEFSLRNIRSRDSLYGSDER